MRVGFFGGSFDPPHLAHVWLLSWALSSGELDRVLVMVCYSHPFAKGLSPFDVRLDMARDAFALFGDRVEVSDLERQWGGVSTTLLSLQRLKQTHPEDQLRLVIGSDILGEAEKWTRFDEVTRLAPPLITPRNNHGPESLWALPDISSTWVRQRVTAGLSIRELVPAAVADRIAKEGLYR